MPNRRPQLTIVAPSASTEEAAAVVAAVERFLRDTAPPPAPPAPAVDRWQRAALLEGVDREGGGLSGGEWGDVAAWVGRAPTRNVRAVRSTGRPAVRRGGGRGRTGRRR